MFRRYRCDVYVNGTWFSAVIIDPHLSEGHKDISPNLVLSLISQLHLEEVEPVEVDWLGFEYYVNDFVLEKKYYRIVWLIPPGKGYLGVRTVYRRSK